jgi:hypothetical protein
MILHFHQYAEQIPSAGRKSYEKTIPAGARSKLEEWMAVLRLRVPAEFRPEKVLSAGPKFTRIAAPIFSTARTKVLAWQHGAGLCERMGLVVLSGSPGFITSPSGGMG